MATKSKYLYTDQTGLRKHLDIEQNLRCIATDLVELSEKALGNKDNIDSYKDLIERPSLYLVQRYWELFCTDKPQHLDRVSVFVSDTNISLERLRALSKEWREQILRMLPNTTPTVNKEGITWNVKENRFKHYLDDTKQDHYNALNNLIDAVNKLKEYEPNNQIMHLNRFSDNLRINGLDLCIYEQRFGK